ncbi:MAG: tetratricopeptide repeat protein [Candidatus Omnitrophota bacterium]
MQNAEKKVNFFTGLFGRFRKVLIVFLFLTGFFIFYNTFLIDNSLETLKFSLDQTALAYAPSDLNGVDLLLNQAIMNEVTAEKMNNVNVGNLEYVRNAITQGKNYKVIDNMKISLNTVIDEKQKSRGWWLVFLDNANRQIKQFFTDLTNRIRAFFGPKGEEVSEKIDEKLLAQAQQLENEGKLSDALAKYEQFIKKYSSSAQTPIIKIRLANVYQRLKNYGKAQNLYKEVMRAQAGKKEAYIARMLLVNLQQRDKFIKQESTLLAKLTELKETDNEEKQKVLYQLGTVNLQLLDMEEAQKFFKRAVSVNPNSELGQKSRFNSAWVNKEEKKMGVSAEEFRKILAEAKPGSPLAMDARYQLADLLHKQGRFQEAIDLYVKLANDYKGDPVASLCLFQAAASYMYDLNDDAKAQELFGRLSKEYSNSPYAKYLSPKNPIGMFLTYLAPRATRVITWRAGGLLALTGYAGEISKFVLVFEESQFNKGFARWIRQELPDTVGNIYVDIKGSSWTFPKGKFTYEGDLTMGKFDVHGQSEGHLELPKEGGLRLVVTKAILQKIPILPVLVNNTLTGIEIIVRKNFPLIPTNLSMERGRITLEGYGSRRMLTRLSRSSKDLFEGDLTIVDIADTAEQKKLYNNIKEKFPESDFSPVPSDDTESLFLDFFTRECFYASFKLLETVKDSKLDFERSVRTLGQLTYKKQRFRMSYKERDVQVALNRLLYMEFPWLVNNEFLFDLRGMELHFTDKGDIEFESQINLGRTGDPIDMDKAKEISVTGRFTLNIDQKSKIPFIHFESVYLDGKKFPVDRMNKVALRCLEVLKDGHVPFELEKVDITDGNIVLQGMAAPDYANRIFSDPFLFVIFQIREWDLWAAGIKRIKGRAKDQYFEFFRGRFLPGMREQTK